MYSHQHYIHVHTFHSSCRCPYFFIVISMLKLFSRFLLVCLKKFEKIQKYLLLLFSFSFQLSLIVALKENPKRFLAFSFTCWELSSVNSFLFSFSFFFFNLLSSEKPKTPKIFQCFFLKFFSFFESSYGEYYATIVEWLICYIVDLIKEPILPCLLP